MELDTQVEEPVLPDSLQNEHKRKHKSKDKHKNKHKHHKRPKRDRTSTEAGDLLGEDSGQVKVAALGFEDGELPGAPAAARDTSPLSAQADVPETLSAEHHASTPAINIRSVVTVHDKPPCLHGVKHSGVSKYARLPGAVWSRTIFVTAGMNMRISQTLVSLIPL